MGWFIVVIRDGESSDVVLDEFPCGEEAKLYALSEARLREDGRQAEHVRITVGAVRDGDVDHLGRWARAVPTGWSWRDGED